MSYEDFEHEDLPISEQLKQLSSEVIETRKQLIKTANMLGNLSAEVKHVSRQQQQERRGLSLNSAAAYVLFVLLTASGFFFVYRSQVERLDAEKSALRREHEAALTDLAAMRKAEERRRTAEDKAASFYRLSQSGKVHRALKEYGEVAQLPLSRVESALFHDWASKTRNRLAYNAYRSGMQAVGAKDWKRAVTNFRGALRHLPKPPHEASLRYYLGVALMNLGSYKEAAEELEQALHIGAEDSISREIRFYLGSVYEQSARRERAIRAYRAYIKRHPSTGYARLARRRIKALQ